MALTNAQRQQGYKSRLKAGIPIIKVVRPMPSPVTRKGRYAVVVAALTALRDEYQTWMDNLPADYADKSDANANRQAEVEAFLEHINEVLELLDTIEVPRIRLD